ncbi:MAG: AbrB/MazE/SpoVT family DNA-binding domain-containing protein [bacterium]|nr:AbrB/MazE/SpoVT family DNA-binding domain-containing protein [bacterium]
MKTTTIKKWGNSYAIRLPKESMHRLNLREGNTVRLVEDVKTSQLYIVPTKKDPETLSQLLSEITKANKHAELSWGEPKGKEAW